MNDWFDERYIKEIPIEEQIRRQVRAECCYMDKADIYEWITQNEIKIMNLQQENERKNNIIKEIKEMLECPYNIECISQNNAFLRRIKELEGKNEL